MNKKSIIKKYLKVKSDGKGGMGLANSTPMTGYASLKKITTPNATVKASSFKPKTPYTESPEVMKQKAAVTSAHQSKYGAPLNFMKKGDAVDSSMRRGESTADLMKRLGKPKRKTGF